MAAAPTGPVMPMAIDLAGRPGVPKGISGQVYVEVPRRDAPADPAISTACHDDKPPPRDILHGEPADVLGGPPSPDLLRGPGHPHVQVQEVPVTRPRVPADGNHTKSLAAVAVHILCHVVLQTTR